MAPLSIRARQLEAEIDKRRRDAPGWIRQACATGRTRRDDVAELLEGSDDWDVRYRCAMALGEIGGAFEPLVRGLVCDSNSDVRRACIDGLRRMGPGALDAAALAAAEAYAQSGNWNHLDAVVETGSRVGRRAAVNSLLSQDVEARARATEYFLYRFWVVYRGEWDLSVSLLWSSLPADERHRLRNHAAYDWVYGRHTLLNISGAVDVERVIDQLARGFPGPWVQQGAGIGLEAVMGLRLASSSIVREVNTLRFAFLTQHATGPEGESFATVLRQAPGSYRTAYTLERLTEMEQETDRQREDIARQRHHLRSLLVREGEEAARRDRSEDRDSSRRGSEGLRGEIEAIAQSIYEAEQMLEGPEGRLRPLVSATEQLLPYLREQRLRFLAVPIEGVLGEYSPLDEAVTLYPPMADLVAGDLGLQLPGGSGYGPTPGTYSANLQVLILIHEMAHAVSHLGLNLDGQSWQGFRDAPRAWHETIAQYYTSWVLRQSGEDDLASLFTALVQKQPAEYRFWEQIAEIPPERVRGLLLLGAMGSIRRADQLCEEVVGFLGTNAGFLSVRLGAPAWDSVREAARIARSRLREAQSGYDDATAVSDFLQVCQSIPLLQETLNGVLVGGWPDRESLAFMALAALVAVDTEALGDSPLRAVTLRPAGTRQVAPSRRDGDLQRGLEKITTAERPQQDESGQTTNDGQTRSVALQR